MLRVDAVETVLYASGCGSAEETSSLVTGGTRCPPLPPPAPDTYLAQE